MFGVIFRDQCSTKDTRFFEQTFHAELGLEAVSIICFPKNPKILWRWVWVKCPIGKQFGKHIFIHYFITFLGEHSSVNNVINALLGLCYCVYVQVFVVNYFL